MTLDIDTLADAPRIVQRQAVAALNDARAQAARHSKIVALVLGPGRGRYVGDVVTLVRDAAAPQEDISCDVYAVEVRDGRDHVDAQWTTVVNGETDGTHFVGASGRWQAILHAVALAHAGTPYGDETASFYAARVLGVPIED